MASQRTKPFAEAALPADARRKADPSDFGDDAFRTPLRVLLASLAQAPLNAVGTLILRAAIRRSLHSACSPRTGSRGSPRPRTRASRARSWWWA
jgi:hypothetical protein